MVLETRVGCTFLENLCSGKEDRPLVLDFQRYWARNEDTDLTKNNKIITSSKLATRRGVT